ncbi:MAG TPA: hypothetical protein VMG82_02160 [Candidatus Sulfotelmatobacter sp.]|nr:hypothetical protein [Candidatus Sulfotelmatobacter sp.]
MGKIMSVRRVTRFFEGSRAVQSLSSVQIKELTWRVSVTNNEVRVNLTMDGREGSVHARFLHVWAKQNGHWQLAAHQGTKID